MKTAVFSLRGTKRRQNSIAKADDSAARIFSFYIGVRSGIDLEPPPTPTGSKTLPKYQK
jgi:hypothetical protein